MERICKHCQVRIVRVNSIYGWRYIHQPADGPDDVSQYLFCQLMKAEPAEEDNGSPIPTSRKSDQ